MNDEQQIWEAYVSPERTYALMGEDAMSNDTGNQNSSPGDGSSLSSALAGIYKKKPGHQNPQALQLSRGVEIKELSNLKQAVADGHFDDMPDVMNTINTRIAEIEKKHADNPVEDYTEYNPKKIDPPKNVRQPNPEFKSPGFS